MEIFVKLLLLLHAGRNGMVNQIDALVQPRFARLGCVVVIGSSHSIGENGLTLLVGVHGQPHHCVTCAAFLSIPIPSASFLVSSCSLQRHRHLLLISGANQQADRNARVLCYLQAVLRFSCFQFTRISRIVDLRKA